MAGQDRLFVGLRGAVLALDPRSGSELWRRDLKGADFVNVMLFDGAVVAATKGELFALDPASGTLLWHNKLKGLGMGLVSIAGDGQSMETMEAWRRKRQAAAAAS